MKNIEILFHVKRALNILLKNDLWLLQSDANERSISHKLAEYLQQEFQDWNVDCEYNRDGLDPKALVFPSEQPTADDEHAKTVFPDIIVHHRNTLDNLLVIEMKKSSNPTSPDFDRQKLKAFVKQKGYRLGLFIQVQVGDKPRFRFERYE